MPAPKRIAAIVPVYNRERFVGDALDSIAAQTRLPDEIVIVDDGSTDNSVNVVRRWQDEHDLPLRLIQQPNAGAAAARNTAIRAAQSELIAPLDSDDVWLPEHLEMLEDALVRHPDLVVSAGNTRRLDNVPRFKRVAYDDRLFNCIEHECVGERLRIIRASAFRSLIKGAYIQTSSCLFRKSDAMGVGLFDETLRSYEDQLFFLRLAKRGGIALYLDPVTGVRKHDDNLTHRRHIASHILCSIRALQKVICDAERLQLTDAERDATLRRLTYVLNGAADRASRYGLRPYFRVCRELLQRGHVRCILRIKPMLRALLWPRGVKRDDASPDRRSTGDLAEAARTA